MSDAERAWWKRGFFFNGRHSVGTRVIVAIAIFVIVAVIVAPSDEDRVRAQCERELIIRTGLDGPDLVDLVEACVRVEMSRR